MLICAAGDIHGALDRLYDDVLAFEQSLGLRFDCVLHVGDFGVWPDPDRVDKATRKHDGAGDFPAWFARRRAAPRPTVFIKVAMPGNLVAVDVPARGRGYEILGEWPRREQVASRAGCTRRGGFEVIFVGRSLQGWRIFGRSGK